MKPAVRYPLGACLVLLALALAECCWLSRTETDYPGSHFNSGRNAVWLEHAWAGEAHDQAAYDHLAGRLLQERVGFVYVHVGPLTPQGSIPAERAPNAAQLVTALKQRAPRLMIAAWIGQVERAGGQPADRSVDLSDPRVRSAIAATARRVVEEEGFDGVHVDIEPLVDGNPSFLDLLEATRAAMPAGKLLSVAAPMWVPSGWVARSLRRIAGREHALWSTAYYTAVASRADQIVVMAYNTGLPLGRLYQVAVKV